MHSLFVGNRMADNRDSIKERHHFVDVDRVFLCRRHVKDKIRQCSPGSEWYALFLDQLLRQRSAYWRSLGIANANASPAYRQTQL